MEPLFRLEHPEVQTRIPKSVMKKIGARLRYLDEGVKRVEKAAGLKYPPYYVEPFLPIMASALEPSQIGVVYARTLPLEVNGALEIVVQVTAALIVYGSKATLHAVLAHEFLHYASLVKQFSSREMLSSELTSSMFETVHVDTSGFSQLERIYKDRSLRRLLKRKFSNGLVDEKLHEKVLKHWLAKGLPTIRLTPDSNVVRLSIHSILNLKFDQSLLAKLKELEECRR
ncbi:MAG: hypothetical protein HA494_02025 [Thaumarchaeota archaeon]|nr:hypothetical protein [Nitrososphaerota archaeon]